MEWSVMTKKLLGKQLLRFKSIVALYSIICSILFSFSFAAPAGVFCINNGDESTSSTNVILNNKINIKLTEMRFSNDNKKFSKWEKFAKKKSWTLDPKPGVKTVYAEFRDGNKKHNNKKNDLHKKSDTIKLVSGSLKWQKSLGGTEFDAAYSIRQTTDGGYIVAGQSRSNDGDVSGNHGG